MKAPLFRKVAGSSLIEVVLAMAVVAFGMVAVLGVMPNAFDSAASSQHETRAVEIASRLFSQMANQKYTEIRLASYGYNGVRTSRDRIINLELPGNSTPRLISWSNADGPSSADGPFKTADNKLTANYRGVIFDSDGGEWFLDKPTVNEAEARSSAEKFAVYRIRISVDSDPAIPEIADPKVARRVTIRVSWPPHNQNFRDYVRVISR
ncbi:MAG: hypothetical protein JSR82_16010 [Verrucomicrobia bacterium]|nr:hypothetical protein [Verrucomicrobiota bacterium]